MQVTAVPYSLNSQHLSAHFRVCGPQVQGKSVCRFYHTALSFEYILSLQLRALP